MHLIVGLRNPGREYEETRHNVGAEVIATLADRWGVTLKGKRLRGPGGAVVAGTVREGQAVTLALPTTFMNVCGPPVASLLRYYKIDPFDLLVVHDDIDLPFARLRLQYARGSGGHNGVRSIVQSLGNNEFHRLKVGVGRPPGRTDPAAFVLKPFRPTEREVVDILVQEAADVAETWIGDRDGAVHLAARRRG